MKIKKTKNRKMYSIWYEGTNLVSLLPYKQKISFDGKEMTVRQAYLAQYVDIPKGYIP